MASLYTLFTDGNLISTTLVFIVVLLCVAYLANGRRYKYPPGPMRLPLVGSTPFLNKDLQSDISKLVKKHNSDVIGLQFGPINAVIINSYEKIKETFLGDEVTDRSANFLPTVIVKGQGLVHASGNLWREQRRHALTVLRNFGMGKMAAEERINNEIAYLKEAIDKQDGRQFDPFNMLTTTISNIICAISFGKRYEYDDVEFQMLIKSLNDVANQANFSGLTFVMPSLRHLPGDLFGTKIFVNTLSKISRLASGHVEEHKARYNPSNDDDDFIDAYLTEMERMENKKPRVQHTFTDSQLTAVIRDLFFAGTETTSSTMRWALALMVKHPDIQQKVQHEIDNVIGSDHIPQMRDRLILPYTEAVLLEIQRVASLTSLSLPHTNNETDIKLYSYDVPKNSMVFANLYGVHHDPSIWPNPNTFDPRNFISEEGTLRNQEYLIPFSIGKRSCPGEGLAKMELFLIFVSIMQVYTVLPSDEGYPNLDNIYSNIRTPPPYKIKLQRRIK
ncbi:cytochrome P450 2J2-like [Tubulanus polymorphus]|uniref:cytochrome P450 2J2-like n=1 Tax=Tubulanus polymorphus TaxID=672921 RepID=UPI003DA1DE22